MSLEYKIAIVATALSLSALVCGWYSGLRAMDCNYSIARGEWERRQHAFYFIATAAVVVAILAAAIGLVTA